MSIAASGWIDSHAVVYCLPIQTVYTFHVPLFFVCSGYLYQMKPPDTSQHERIRFIKRKLLDLGVPYLIFSAVTLILKIVFSDSVNNQAPPFFRTLLWEPIAPYWYLYTLLLLFCIIPRQRKRRDTVGLFCVCIIVKIIYIAFPVQNFLPDLVEKICANAIWFSFGMLLTDVQIRQLLIRRNIGLVCFLVAIGLSASFYSKDNQSLIFQFIVALLFVYSITAFFILELKTGDSHWIAALSEYFLPIYVLHTITAAGARTILTKMGISFLPLHVAVGLIASIAIPILIYQFASKYWWSQFPFEPSKALKRRTVQNG